MHIRSERMAALLCKNYFLAYTGSDYSYEELYKGNKVESGELQGQVFRSHLLQERVHRLCRE